MSADSQATGTNYLTSPSLANTGQFAFAVWWKLDGWSKHGFDTAIEIGNGGVAPNRKMVALQQDWSGTSGGNAHVMQFGAYDEASNQDASSGTIVSVTGTWIFCLFYINGNSLTVWYGTESGALSSYSVALPGSNTASDFNTVLLGTDNFGTLGVGELSWSSFRGARAWSNTTFNSTEATAERDSTTFAAAKATGLVNVLPLANGTSPETATTGSNWARTGTFVDDASNPTFGGTTYDVTPSDTLAVSDSLSNQVDKTLADAASITDSAIAGREQDRSASDTMAFDVDTVTAVNLAILDRTAGKNKFID